MNEEFWTNQMKAWEDGEVQVLPFNGMMAICMEDGPVIISKEQAMRFFGLVEADK